MLPSPSGKTLKYSASVDKLQGFNFLTSLPVEELIAETKRAQEKEVKLCKSVIESRF